MRGENRKKSGNRYADRAQNVLFECALAGRGHEHPVHQLRRGDQRQSRGHAPRHGGREPRATDVATQSVLYDEMIRNVRQELSAIRALQGHYATIAGLCRCVSGSRCSV